MRRSPNKYLVLALIVSALAGTGEPFLPAKDAPAGYLTFPFGLTCAVLFFGWCKAHVKSSNIEEPSGSALLCGLLAPVGVPLYFFRAFGIKGGFIRTAKAVVFLILFALAYGIPNATLHFHFGS